MPFPVPYRRRSIPMEALAKDFDGAPNATTIEEVVNVLENSSGFRVITVDYATPTLPTSGDADSRLLVYDESDKKNNGVYGISHDGSTVTRTTDPIAPGMLVLAGNPGDDSFGGLFFLRNNVQPVIGDDELIFYRLDNLRLIMANLTGFGSIYSYNNYNVSTLNFQSDDNTVKVGQPRLDATEDGTAITIPFSVELWKYSAPSSLTPSVAQADEFVGIKACPPTGVAVTLPAPGAFGRPKVIKDESGAAGTGTGIVITPTSGLIDGAASKTIGANFGVLRVYSDGTNLYTW